MPDHIATATCRRVVAALVVAGLLAGCSGDDGASNADETTPSSMELTPETTTTTTPADAELAEVLLDEDPPGFRRADDELGAGPMGIEEAILLDPDREAEQARLEDAGFERGTSKVWMDERQDVVYLTVFDFEDAEGAEAYAEAADERMAAEATSTFEVPEVEGATGYTTTEAGEEGESATHEVAFTVGDKWFLVVAFSMEGRASEETARGLAAAQATRAAERS